MTTSNTDYTAMVRQTLAFFREEDERKRAKAEQRKREEDERKRTEAATLVALHAVLDREHVRLAHGDGMTAPALCL